MVVCDVNEPCKVWVIVNRFEMRWVDLIIWNLSVVLQYTSLSHVTHCPLKKTHDRPVLPLTRNSLPTQHDSWPTCSPSTRNSLPTQHNSCCWCFSCCVGRHLGGRNATTKISQTITFSTTALCVPFLEAWYVSKVWRYIS